MTESRLQHLCYKWFRATYPHEANYLWMNYNNPKSAAHGAILVGMGLHAGVADMTYLAAKSFPYFLEFKGENGCQSKIQKQWQKAIVARGGVYALIKSEDDFKGWIRIAQCHAGHTCKTPLAMMAWADENRVDPYHLQVVHTYLWLHQKAVLPTETMEYFSNLNLITA